MERSPIVETICAIIGALFVIWLFTSCQTAPVVSPQPNIAAIKESNQRTSQHIKSSQEHIKHTQEGEADVDKHLDSIANDLDQLLKE